MKKEIKNLSCPICHSNNITIYKKNTDKEQIEYNDTTKIRPNLYECHCLDCNHTYKISYGYETQTVCANPTPLNGLKDVKILSYYKSDSPLDKNYKIISIENDKEQAYLIFAEEEEFPIMLSKEKVPEMIKEPPKVLTLIKNTCDKRKQ